MQLLYWLPLIFLVWANLHIQFIYGLVSGWTADGGECGAAAWLSRFGFAPQWLSPPKLPAATLVAVFAACVIATCIGPNSYHLYQVIFQYSQAKVPYRMIMELQPLNFRAGSHYVELLLMAFAFFAVGRQRKVDAFKLLLLSIAGAVAFRTMRDAWFICIPAAACIADSLADETESEAKETWLQKGVVAAVVALTLLLFARSADFNTRGLDRAISGFLPVNAVTTCASIRRQGRSTTRSTGAAFSSGTCRTIPSPSTGAPISTETNWMSSFFETANGAPSYVDDPYLNQAGVVILQKTNNLVSTLAGGLAIPTCVPGRAGGGVRAQSP